MKTEKEKELQRLKERKNDRWDLFFASAMQGLLIRNTDGLTPSHCIVHAKELAIDMVYISERRENETN